MPNPSEIERGKRDVPTACRARQRRESTASCVHEKQYTDDEREFMMALDRWKRDNRRPFPTCCEVLSVLVSLGYDKRH